MNSRCQVDLIDMQFQAEEGYTFVTVYQDHLTKFVSLRPLQSNRAEEIAFQPTDIFLTFGVPCVLHSDNGRVCEICDNGDLYIVARVKDRSRQTATQPKPRFCRTSQPRHTEYVGFMDGRQPYHELVKWSPLCAMYEEQSLSFRD